MQELPDRSGLDTAKIAVCKHLIAQFLIRWKRDLQLEPMDLIAMAMALEAASTELRREAASHE